MLLFILLTITSSKIVDVTLSLGYMNHTYNKIIIAINQSKVGPLIETVKGDTLRVKVLNNLENEQITIHWHGIEMHCTPYYDGVPYVTQYPISPKDEIIYEFITNKAGTFWYHSHIEPQRDDACFGALIVYPSDNETTKNELIWILSDFYLSTERLQTHLLDEGKWVGPPDLLLMNGDVDHLINLQPNTEYKIRLISAATISRYSFLIPGHNLTVQEVEGCNIVPYTTSSIIINAGERYSFMIRTLSKGCYRIRFDSSDLRGSSTLMITNASSCVEDNSIISFDPLLLQSLDTYLPLPTKRIEITTSYIIHDEIPKYQFNDKSYSNERIPLILAKFYQVPYQSNSIFVEEGDVLDIVFVNTDNKQHPIHIHGHSFWVLSSGRPIKRDTFTLPACSNMTVRLEANNPGIWMIHCHVTWHAMMGMGLVMEYSQVPGPPLGFDTRSLRVNHLEEIISCLKLLAFVAVGILGLIVIVSTLVVFKRIVSDDSEEERPIYISSNGITVV